MLMRYKTKLWDSPEMNGYPSYCVWDTELNEIADENGLLLIFSSVTGEIACNDANAKTLELNIMTCFNFSHYVRTENEADRLLADRLKRGMLIKGITMNDGTKTHPWVVRGVKK